MLLREDVPAGCSPTGMDRPGGSGIALGLSRTQTVGQHMQASTRCECECACVCASARVHVRVRVRVRVRVCVREGGGLSRVQRMTGPESPWCRETPCGAWLCGLAEEAGLRMGWFMAVAKMAVIRAL